MVGFVYDDDLEPTRVKLLQSLRLLKRLIGCNSSEKGQMLCEFRNEMEVRKWGRLHICQPSRSMLLALLNLHSELWTKESQLRRGLAGQFDRSDEDK